MFGVSFDSQEANLAFAEKEGFPFPLLCDTEREIGLAYRACERKEDDYPRRITYVIGSDGAIEKAIETKDVSAQAGELLAYLSETASA